MERSNKDIQDWANSTKREALNLAKEIAQKRMNKDIEDCSKQVKLKIMASVDRIIYG